jgi:hypothetical protein
MRSLGLGYLSSYFYGVYGVKYLVWCSLNLVSLDDAVCFWGFLAWGRRGKGRGKPRNDIKCIRTSRVYSVGMLAGDWIALAVGFSKQARPI